MFFMGFSQVGWDVFSTGSESPLPNPPPLPLFTSIPTLGASWEDFRLSALEGFDQKIRGHAARCWSFFFGPYENPRFCPKSKLVFFLIGSLGFEEVGLYGTPLKNPNPNHQFEALAH